MILQNLKIMRTVKEICAAIDEAKKKLMKASSTSALTKSIDELSQLTWRLSLHEQGPSAKVDVCVFATAPMSASVDSAKKLSEHYRHKTHIKAWETLEPNEVVIFPVDYADLIKVLGDLEEWGYEYRVEKKG